MRLREEAVGLRSFDVVDAQAEVVGLAHRTRVDLLGLGTSNDPIASVQVLVVIVPPVILRLQWVHNSLGLEDAVFVDILHLQPRHSFPFLGQLRWTAAFDRLSQYFSSSVLPSVAAFSIDIIDLQRISDEASTVVGHDFRSRRQDVLGTQRVHVSFGAELHSLRLCSLNIVNVKRIGGLIDVLAAIGYGFDKGRKAEVGRSGTLRDEDLGRSASNIMLQEG